MKQKFLEIGWLYGTNTSCTHICSKYSLTDPGASRSPGVYSDNYTMLKLEGQSSGPMCKLDPNTTFTRCKRLQKFHRLYEKKKKKIPFVHSYVIVN